MHLLLAVTEETIPRHRHKIVEGGAIIYDSKLQIGRDAISPYHVWPIPLSDIAKEKAGTELARNTVALGAAAGLLVLGTFIANALWYFVQMV